MLISVLLSPLELSFGHKINCIRCLNDSYKNVSRISSLLGKIVIFLYTGKIIQVLDFNNWHPLNEVILCKRAKLVEEDKSAAR